MFFKVKKNLAASVSASETGCIFRIKGWLVESSGRIQYECFKFKSAKFKALLCSLNDVRAHASEHMNIGVLPSIQCSLSCYLACIHLSLYAQKSAWHPHRHFISLTCLLGFFAGYPHRLLIVSHIFSPLPFFILPWNA